MSEPTGILSFQDLIIEVAEKVGTAYYGAAGDEAAQVPVDAHDLNQCKKIVNDAIRMFIHDAPKTGWKWTRPVAEIALWPSVATDATNTVSGGSYDTGNNQTTLTAQKASFYPSMELRYITITGTTTPFSIKTYLSSTQIVVDGDAHGVSAKTWSMTSTGDYTLPQTFGGQHTGVITFRGGTNRGVRLDWVDESNIRDRRSNVTQETGTPYQFAVRLVSSEVTTVAAPTPLAGSGTPRRRWELLCYRQPAELLYVQFPYALYFNALVNLTDVHPAPYAHDETIKAACLAVAGKKVDDSIDTPDWHYYRDICLPNSYEVDSRSGPKSLGYFGNPSATVDARSAIRSFRDSWYQRPAVPFNQ